MIKLLIGNVVKTGSSQTATVVVERMKTHPLYGKRYKVTKKYLVHDPDTKLKVGDRVEIQPIRPVSKRKHWGLKSVVIEASSTEIQS